RRDAEITRRGIRRAGRRAALVRLRRGGAADAGGRDRGARGPITGRARTPCGDENLIMPLPRWSWLSRLSRLLATPRAEPAQNARRILTMQRNIVLPAKAMVMGVVLYYLFYSRWLDEVATTQAVILETLQNFF